MTYGYLAALVQENVIRLLAYSSIAQSGYFLLGIVAVGSSELALPSIILFAAAYAAMNLGAFAVAAATGRTLNDFGGLGRARPLMGIAMVVFLLSLVGIPPLAGFVGKFLLLLPPSMSSLPGWRWWRSSTACCRLRCICASSCRCTGEGRLQPLQRAHGPAS